jgi:hypothetical protein
MAPQFDRALRDLLHAAGAGLSGKAAAAMKSGTVQSPHETSRYPLAFRAGTPPTPSCVRPAYRRHFDVSF